MDFRKRHVDQTPAIQKSGAIISECGLYRYRLWRIWDEERAFLVWIMQNPSTADAVDDDPTIRKCIGFSERAGYGGIVVMNVFAWRAADERELLKAPDPIGPENWDYLIGATNIRLGSRVVAAWGNRFGPKRKSIFRDAYCHAAAACVQQGAVCLGTTKSGDPKHPLFVSYEAEMVRWNQPSY